MENTVQVRPSKSEGVKKEVIMELLGIKTRKFRELVAKTRCASGAQVGCASGAQVKSNQYTGQASIYTLAETIAICKVAGRDSIGSLLYTNVILSRENEYLHKVIELGQEKQDALTHDLHGLPALGYNYRHMLTKHINKYCIATESDHEDIYHLLYDELENMTGNSYYKIKDRNREKLKSTLDAVEYAGDMSRAYSLAMELFPLTENN